jgi:hypothetical protein
MKDDALEPHAHVIASAAQPLKPCEIDGPSASTVSHGVDGVARRRALAVQCGVLFSRRILFGRLVVLGVVVGAFATAACRNTIVENLGDAGPADAGADADGEGEGEGECPNSDEPALSVHVVDGAPSFTLCGDVTVTVTDGAFSTTATPTGVGESCRHLAAPGRPGTYTVTASGVGYATTTLDNLVVDADACDDPVAARQVSLTLPPA